MHLLRGIGKTQMASSCLKALQGSRRWISSKRKGLIGFGFHHLYLLSHVNTNAINKAHFLLLESYCANLANLFKLANCLDVIIAALIVLLTKALV